MGGLSRKQYAILDTSKNKPTPRLLLDGGNALFAVPQVKDRESQQVLSARGIARIYKAMAYDAVNVAPNDLAAGIDFLLELPSVPWVSANFFDKSGKPVFNRYVEKDIGASRIAITGVTVAPPGNQPDYFHQEWEKVLPPLIEELSGKSDFIILLSALPQPVNLGIARQFPQIRLIISAENALGNAPPLVSNNAIITHTANRGKYLGHLHVDNVQSKTWRRNAGMTEEQLSQQIDAFTFRIERLKSKGKDNGTVQRLSGRREELRQELKSLEQERSSPQQAATDYTVEFMALTTDIPEDGAIRKLQEEVRLQINASNAEKRKKLRERISTSN